MSDFFPKDGAHRAAAIAALGAAFLAFAKLLLFAWTGSLIVALSAWDSAQDVLVSFLNQKIIKYARQTADDDHPYGHGKAESIAALGQGALISGGALVILASSFQVMGRAWSGHKDVVDANWQTAAFFVGAALLSCLITRYLKVNSKRHNSPALFADSQHYQTDVIVNLASAGGMMIVLWTNQPWLDPLLASVFAIYIARNGITLIRTSIQELMDQKVDDEVHKHVLQLIYDTDDRIVDIHNFRGRKSGHRFFFDFHVTLPTNLQFMESHELVESIEERVKSHYDADVVVHADPDILPLTGDEHLALSRRPELKGN
jgi:ferrous-iron efflux pump FieF